MAAHIYTLYALQFTRPFRGRKMVAHHSVPIYMHSRNNATRYPPTATNSCIGRQCGSGSRNDCASKGSVRGQSGSAGVEPKEDQRRMREMSNGKDATVNNGIVMWSRGIYSCVSDDESEASNPVVDPEERDRTIVDRQMSTRSVRDVCSTFPGGGQVQPERRNIRREPIFGSVWNTPERC